MEGYRALRKQGDEIGLALRCGGLGGIRMSLEQKTGMGSSLTSKGAKYASSGRIRSPTASGVTLPFKYAANSVAANVSCFLYQISDIKGFFFNRCPID